MDNLYAFFVEMDKLKSVYRRSYLTDFSRNENSAEHSWHLALAILTMKEEFSLEIDINRTVKMALVHDICEIGAGDISIYDPDRSMKEEQERAYLRTLSKMPVIFSSEISSLWEEYEAQQTAESRWVKIVDRLLPFMLNMSTEGKAWREQGIKRSQVKEVNQVMATEAPDIYRWLLAQIDAAVENGWLIDDDLPL